MNPASKTTNPTACMARAQKTTWIVILVISPKFEVPIASRIKRRCDKEIRWPARISNELAIVMIPSPPAKMRTRIIICPERVQNSGVDWVIKPVTVAAEVAVNSASAKGTKPSPWCVKGSISNPVPIAMIMIKE